MTEQKKGPIDQALLEIPVTPYENIDYKKAYFLVAMICILASIMTQNIVHVNEHSFGAHLVGAILWTMGTMADRISTGRGLDAGIKTREVGVEGYKVVESNPVWGKVTSSADFHYSPRTWAIDAVGVAIGASVPVLGVVGGISRVLISAGNFRIARRGDRIAELALLEKTPSEVQQSIK